MSNVNIKEKFINKKLKMLKDFGIPVTDEVIDRINSLYPSEIAIENYTRKLISQKLWNK